MSCGHSLCGAVQCSLSRHALCDQFNLTARIPHRDMKSSCASLRQDLVLTSCPLLHNAIPIFNKSESDANRRRVDCCRDGWRPRFPSGPRGSGSCQRVGCYPCAGRWPSCPVAPASEPEAPARQRLPCSTAASASASAARVTVQPREIVSPTYHAAAAAACCPRPSVAWRRPASRTSYTCSARSGACRCSLHRTPGTRCALCRARTATRCRTCGQRMWPIE